MQVCDSKHSEAENLLTFLAAEDSDQSTADFPLHATDVSPGRIGEPTNQSMGGHTRPAHIPNLRNCKLIQPICSQAH